MEVDASSFPGQLLEILEAISNAHFVAFDLELSGIYRQPNRASNTRGNGKQTLQQRYSEIKEAAERYTILQVGITCIQEDVDDGRYIARPYNFNVNPLIAERLDFERIISFQSGAVEFLLGHGFRLEVPFRSGVPYLSRQEEFVARQQALRRQDRSGFADVFLKEEDLESLAFVRRVRSEVREWVARPIPQPEYLNIAPVGFEVDPQTNRGLSNFEKKLVHQLVRAEFPDLVTISRPTFIQIVAFDKDREDAIKRGKERRLEEQITRQIGLRWLFEAMSGGDLSGLDPRIFGRTNTGEAKFTDMAALSRRLATLQTRLKERRTILVGHNLFTDLINLYRVFFGKLPEMVMDFQRLIHSLFPMIVDTKYLATHNCTTVNPRSSLEEIEEDLRSQLKPVIVTDPEHSKYLVNEAAHEAGYDSYLTATVTIRLSTLLNVAALSRTTDSRPSSNEDQYNDASEDGGVSLTDVDSTTVGNLKIEKEQRSSESFASTTLQDTTNNQMRRKAGASERIKANQVLSSSDIAHSGRFDVLRDLETDQERSSQERDLELSKQAASGNGQSAEGTSSEAANMSLMPSFEGPFWKVYGNKLRVFGTQEDICDLNFDGGV